jgi:ribosomal protein S18 acetylase RimI-like enzyme
MTTPGADPLASATPLEIPSPAGAISLRPEREADRAFRYQLFCDSRQPEFALMLPPEVFQQVMAHQFHAQTVSYQGQYPQGRFDIIEIAGRPIGRIVVDRADDRLHIVDQAIIPGLRGRGIGTAVMRALMDESAARGVPVTLHVASSNDPSMRLYLRLGFVPTESTALYITLTWTPPGGKRPC